THRKVGTQSHGPTALRFLFWSSRALRFASRLNWKRGATVARLPKGAAVVLLGARFSGVIPQPWGSLAYVPRHFYQPSSQFLHEFLAGYACARGAGNPCCALCPVGQCLAAREFGDPQ